MVAACFADNCIFPLWKSKILYPDKLKYPIFYLYLRKKKEKIIILNKLNQ